jgi:two-component system osmolarity sensor histidine kinase EnvZ
MSLRLPQGKRVVKRMLPRGLLGRSLLIMLVPLLIVQAVALQIFYGTNLSVVSRRLSAAVAGEIAIVVDVIERNPNDTHERAFALVRDRLELEMRLRPGTLLPEHMRPPMFAIVERSLQVALAERVQRPVALDWQSDENAVIVRVQLPDGVLEVAVPRKRLFSAALWLFVVWLVGSSLLMFGIAALFMRNQVRSVARLARAMDAFGKGRDPGPIRPSGAAEVRQAAGAFNLMQERVRRFLAQRTQMLAGVSHDLRTPLTRLRLSLAMLPADEASQEDIADMTADLEEMDRMIGGYLAFVRGVGEERTAPTDLAALLEEIAGRARRAGGDIVVAAPTTLTLPLRADAFSRAVTNLVDNARRHARHVAIGARALDGAVEIVIDDDGPGIPPARREDAFRAFDAGPDGGTGLGLTIARDIVQAHGGEIVLEDSAMGGLRVRLTVPA